MINNNKPPLLHELVAVYRNNLEEIKQLNRQKGYFPRTMRQLDIDEKNNFIANYGLELFLHYFTNLDEEIIQFMPQLQHFKRNEELLKQLIYHGSSNLAKKQLEELHQDIVKTKEYYAKGIVAIAERERK